MVKLIIKLLTARGTRGSIHTCIHTYIYTHTHTKQVTLVKLIIKLLTVRGTRASAAVDEDQKGDVNEEQGTFLSLLRGMLSLGQKCAGLETEDAEVCVYASM